METLTKYEGAAILVVVAMLIVATVEPLSCLVFCSAAAASFAAGQLL